VVGTHHVGASTRQAQEAVADGVAEVIDAFARGELLNVVNGPAPDPAGRTTQPTVPRAAPTGAAP
jgi:D-3-phosphoglycerate dehydrogenase